MQGNSEQVRYDKNDARYFLKKKIFYLKNGIRIQMPWLWAGFDGSWSCRRVAEVRRQLDEGGIETLVKVDRMRFTVVNSVLEKVNMIRMKIGSFMNLVLIDIIYL